ncbi:MAG TPA: BadF/BadG/BcrA/BcrD ATPase family protein [Candidatus Binatia bacterium]|nr:BadF/BadG/BcrA/BcrD ATPase family protein [Candidatus Binatia bacterium]
MLAAGIDGGQSSTVAVVGDEHGRILGRGASGPSDEIGAGPDSTRLRDALRSALGNALAHAGLPGDTHCDAIVAGISGYNGRVYGRPPELPARRVVLMHDTPIAHAGALAGRDGVIVIAGTGSVAYTRDRSGAGHIFGGWGFLFGDEGSAFRIACDALAELMRAEDDGDASPDEETRAVLDFFGAPSLRDVARRFYHGEISRERLAAFAPVALTFERFRALANRGADRLAELACRAIDAGGVARVGLAGGVFRDSAFRASVGDGIRARVAGAEVFAARYDPAVGALLIAYRELGIEPELTQ